MSFWFIALTIVTAWSGLFLANAISTDYELRNSELVIGPNTFLIFIFLILSGKALVETLHRAVESKELVLLLTQPVSITKVALGKFLNILFSNLSIVAYGLGMVLMLQLISFHIGSPLTITNDMPDGSGALWVGGYGITHFQVMDIILLSLMASGLGFMFSILNALDLKKRLAGIALLSPVPAGVIIIMREMEVLPWQQTALLVLMTVISYLALLPVIRSSFLEAWVKQTSGKKALFFQKRSWGRLKALERLLDPRMSRLVRKEIVINVQKKEIAGNMVAILGLSILLIWGWQRIEGLEEIPERAADLVYPAIISIGIYLAAVLQCGLIGLGSIGKEGRKFWILKSMPVHQEHMFKAKAIAILSLSPVTIIFVSLPLPMILGYGPGWMMFFVMMTVALIMAFTGIGLIMGAKYPNFNESMGGMPDVMSMYLLMLACLMIGGGMVLFAGLHMAMDMLGGVLATIVVLEMSFIILMIGIRGGAWLYSRIEPRPH